MWEFIAHLYPYLTKFHVYRLRGPFSRNHCDCPRRTSNWSLWSVCLFYIQKFSPMTEAQFSDFNRHCNRKPLPLRFNFRLITIFGKKIRIDLSPKLLHRQKFFGSFFFLRRLNFFRHPHPTRSYSPPTRQYLFCCNYDSKLLFFVKFHFTVFKCLCRSRKRDPYAW